MADKSNFLKVCEYTVDKVKMLLDDVAAYNKARGDDKKSAEAKVSRDVRAIIKSKKYKTLKALFKIGPSKATIKSGKVLIDTKPWFDTEVVAAAKKVKASQESGEEADSSDSSSSSPSTGESFYTDYRLDSIKNESLESTFEIPYIKGIYENFSIYNSFANLQRIFERVNPKFKLSSSDPVKPGHKIKIVLTNGDRVNTNMNNVKKVLLNDTPYNPIEKNRTYVVVKTPEDGQPGSDVTVKIKIANTVYNAGSFQYKESSGDGGDGGDKFKIDPEVGYPGSRVSILLNDKEDEDVDFTKVTRVTFNGDTAAILNNTKKDSILVKAPNADPGSSATIKFYIDDKEFSVNKNFTYRNLSFSIEPNEIYSGKKVTLTLTNADKVGLNLTSVDKVTFKVGDSTTVVTDLDKGDDFIKLKVPNGKPSSNADVSVSIGDKTFNVTNDEVKFHYTGPKFKTTPKEVSPGETITISLMNQDDIGNLEIPVDDSKIEFSRLDSNNPNNVVSTQEVDPVGRSDTSIVVKAVKFPPGSSAKIGVKVGDSIYYTKVQYKPLNMELDPNSGTTGDDITIISNDKVIDLANDSYSIFIRDGSENSTETVLQPDELLNKESGSVHFKAPERKLGAEIVVGIRYGDGDDEVSYDIGTFTYSEEFKDINNKLFEPGRLLCVKVLLPSEGCTEWTILLDRNANEDVVISNLKSKNFKSALNNASKNTDLDGFIVLSEVTAIAKKRPVNVPPYLGRCRYGFDSGSDEDISMSNTISLAVAPISGKSSKTDEKLIYRSTYQITGDITGGLLGKLSASFSDLADRIKNRVNNQPSQSYDSTSNKDDPSIAISKFLHKKFKCTGDSEMYSDYKKIVTFIEKNVADNNLVYSDELSTDMGGYHSSLKDDIINF